MFDIDSYFTIGSNHIVCEDYASHYVLDTVPLIIVSDGCGSAPGSDIGSRLMNLIAKNSLEQFLKLYHVPSVDELRYDVVIRLDRVCKELQVPFMATLASLLVSFAFNNKIYVFMYGDGTFIRQSYNAYDVTSINFKGNAPYYIGYEREYTEFNEDAALIIHNGAESQGAVRGNMWEFPANDTLMVALFSDGIDSFFDESKFIDKGLLLPKFLTFKNKSEGFLKRRLKKGLRELRSEGIGHYDDLSCGVIIRHEY